MHARTLAEGYTLTFEEVLPILHNVKEPFNMNQSLTGWICSCVECLLVSSCIEL